MKPLITIKNLQKSFKSKNEGKPFLDDLNFEILENERIAIVGKNGAGKTILLESILGLRKMKKGVINFHFEYKKSPYEKIGFIFQNDENLNSFYVKDYLNLLISDKNVDLKYLKHLVEKFEIEPILNTNIKNLSGGEKQRVKFLICFSYKPKILFLDEFDNNLDLFIKEEAIKFINEYLTEEKSSLVIISHEPKDIKQLVNKITFLKHGKLSEKLDIKNKNEFQIKKIILENI